MNIKKAFLHPIKMGWYDFQIKCFGAYRFFMKQMNAQERVMIREHYHIAPSAEALTPAIVHTCNGFTWSGGLADRLKGIVAIFCWCKKNNRRFMINFCEPFRLQDYLVPNEYDWLPEGVGYEGRNVLPKIYMQEPRTGKYLENQWSTLFPQWMKESVSDKNMQYHVYTNLYLQDVDFANLFNILFKPSEKLQKEIDYHLSQINGKYVSISFRFTTLLGDFIDCTGSPLNDEDKEKLICDSLKAVERISAMVPKHDKVLVTADSVTFLKRLKGMLGIYIIPGKVGHIDYDHGDDVNMKTFLDFLMISKAEAIYLAKGPGMYNSAFAKTAALINNKPFEVYEY